jgi:hypothetical protein
MSLRPREHTAGEEASANLLHDLIGPEGLVGLNRSPMEEEVPELKRVEDIRIQNGEHTRQ